MGVISPNTPAGKKLDAKSEFVDAKAESVITEINADIAILDGSPTNAQVIQVIRRCLIRQRKIIKYVASLD
jgi:hypothetical protein